MEVIALGVGREQAAHPPAQVAILAGPQDPVEMVGHQATAEEVDGSVPPGPGDRLDEGVEVRRLVEDRGATMATVQGKVNEAADGSASCAWHDSNGAPPAGSSTEIISVPFPPRPLPPSGRNQALVTARQKRTPSAVGVGSKAPVKAWVAASAC